MSFKGYSVIILVIIVGLIFSGCLNTQETHHINDSATSPQESNKNNINNDRTAPLSIGYCLKELDVNIPLENLYIFSDPNYQNYSTSYVINNLTSDAVIDGLIDVNLSLDRNECLSVLGFNFSDNLKDTTHIPLMYVQAFINNSESIPQKFQINRDIYTATELEEYTLYEDNDKIIINITEIIPILSFEEKIKKLRLSNPGYEYDWLFDVYNYIKSNKELIN